MQLIIDVDEDLVCKGFEQPFTEEERDILIRAIGNGKTYEERPKGKWGNTSPYDSDAECSLCCYLSRKYYNFCPNCGADMRGKEE